MSSLPYHFFTIFSMPIESFSVVRRIRNFVHYELFETSIFQNLPKTALITYLIIISMSVAYFASLRLMQCIRNLGHYNTRKISNFQNIPEAAQTTCFRMT